MEKVKIAYIVSAMYYPNGMAKVLSDKINYLADVLSYDVYMIETERADLPSFYSISPKVHRKNFDINFDYIYSKPFLERYKEFFVKQRMFEKMLKEYLLNIKADITVSTLRREINFLSSIKDGSKKIGEIHFGRSHYRKMNIKFLPKIANKILSDLWMSSLIRKIKKLDKFIVLTQEDFAQWPEIERKTVIPNPLISIPIESAQCSNKSVIAVGRYTWQKGFDLLIKAWKIVSLKHGDWNLNIYGSGDRDYYKKLSQEQGCSSSVFCNEAVKNVDEKYRESSIFVLSSRYEGFGMVIIEAMANGLPVVSFECPCGPKDIIGNGLTGLLANKEDINDLANKLCELIENQELRKQMGSLAKESVKKYLIEQVMKKWDSLFKELTK